MTRGHARITTWIVRFYIYIGVIGVIGRASGLTSLTITMNVYYNDYDALYEHIESLKPYCLHLWLAMGGEVTSPFMVPLKLLHMEREIGLIGGTQPQWYTLTFKQVNARGEFYRY